MNKELVDSNNQTESIDISQLSDIKDQKECCDEMIKVLFDEQDRLQSRFLGVQTIYDILESDSEIKKSMSEYIGYQYGIINEAMKMFEISFHNLQRVLSGSYDKLDFGARGMYITLWYNIGLESIRTIDESCEELSQTEADMIKRIMNDEDSETADFLRGSFH